MTLRKTKNDNSVNYIPQSEQIQFFSWERQRDSKPNTIKKNSHPRKQKKTLWQNNKNLFEDHITGEEFGLLNWIMKCYL